MKTSHNSYYWAYVEEHNILIVAVGFGLGPRIAAENLLLDLNLVKEYSISWSNGPLNSVIKFGVVNLLLNFGVLSQLPKIDCSHKIWIDCVDWLRTELPPHIREYDLLLCEAFFSSTYSKEKGDIVYNVHPLIRPPKRNKDINNDLVLMSFGGVATPYSTKTHYFDMPSAFIKGMSKYLEESQVKNVIAFLPPELCEYCESIGIKHRRMELRQLDRKEFSDVITQCGFLICQPGLYTPFEAIQMKLPFALTYPMSFTQKKQGDQFKKIGVNCCHIKDCENEHKVEAGVDIEAIEGSWFETSERDWGLQVENEIIDRVYSFLKQTLSTRNKIPTIEINAPTAASIVMPYLPMEFRNETQV